MSCLLKRGADISLECGFGYRPDDVASRLGHDECRDLICAKRQHRIEELSSIAKKGNLQAQQLRHSDLFNINEDGNTLIMSAAIANRSDNLTILLKMKDSPIDAQHMKTGQTALTLAAINGCQDAIQTLLHYRANPVIKDVEGMTPLQYACKLKCVEIAAALASETRGLTGLQQISTYSLNDEIKELLSLIRQRRQTEIVNPTLFECAITGDVKRLFCTLEEGDNVNPITGSGDWPMYMACGNGHLEVVKLLHENGGDISSQHPTTKSTVLHVACSRGLVDIVKYLIQFCSYERQVPSSQRIQAVDCSGKLDIDAVNNQGLTALQIAASKGYSKLVKKLLQLGASSAILDRRGKLYTCREFEGVQVLIETHRRTRTDRIMLAIKVEKEIKMLKKIWQGKFDHNLRDRSGNTPLMVACLYGKIEALKFLLQTSIQFLEENAQDFERSMRVDHFSDSDSGTFVDCTPGVPARRYSQDYTGGETSNTDYSDQEALENNFFEQGPLFTSTPTVSHEHMRGSFYNISGPLSNIHEDAPSTYSSRKLTNPRRQRRNRTREKPYMSDTEVIREHLFDNAPPSIDPYYDRSRQSRGSAYYPSPGSVHSRAASTYSRNSYRQGTPGLGHQMGTNASCGWSVAGAFRAPERGSVRDLNDNLSEVYFGMTQNGPSIYQGSMVNHLCARNPQDGSTCVHRSVECVDQKRGLKALEMLLDTDKLVVNIQNSAGLTPLHLACQLDRRKIVKKLLKLRYVDLNLRTLDGSLPEDLTSSLKVQKMICSTREQQEFQRSTSTITGGIMSPPKAASTIAPSSVDFDKLQDLYEKHKNRSFHD
ncbi:ankyrin-2-like isoform X2 [Anneissia japonica]|nr:ankyrin-2-like isoform X2 [Anneissia japonica]